MQTFTGRVFWPHDLQRTDIHIVDIAEALSKQCRYAGHCIRFYSVAEHSVLVYRTAQSLGFDRRIQRAALLHDASEAYLVDVPRSVKAHLTNYHEIEDQLMTMIAARYDFDWPLPPEVKWLDNAIIRNERDQNIHYTPTPGMEWSCDRVAPIDVTLQLWTPERARDEYLRAYHEVKNIDYGEV